MRNWLKNTILERCHDREWSKDCSLNWAELNGTERSCLQIELRQGQQMEQTVFISNNYSYKNVTEVNITNESSVELSSFQFGYNFFRTSFTIHL
jgi:hypothetical protein